MLETKRQKGSMTLKIVVSQIAQRTWRAFSCCRCRAPLGSLKQTRTATATWATRKNRLRISNVFATLPIPNLAQFLPFLSKFYCFIVSNYWRATVVISQNDAHVLTTTSKWSNSAAVTLELKKRAKQTKSVCMARTAVTWKLFSFHVTAVRAICLFSWLL